MRFWQRSKMALSRLRTPVKLASMEKVSAVLSNKEADVMLLMDRWWRGFYFSLLVKREFSIGQNFIKKNRARGEITFGPFFFIVSCSKIRNRSLEKHLKSERLKRHKKLRTIKKYKICPPMKKNVTGPSKVSVIKPIR